jgi:hypothetical protein
MALNFPSELETYPYWMTFNFYQYKRPLVGAGRAADYGVLQQNGAIRLPLPNQMIDHQDVQYTQEELGLALGMGINGAQSATNNGASAAALAGGIAGSGGAVEKMLQSRNAAAIGQLAGVAVNPFLTVMFKSPTFKKHQLSWRLSPTNKIESGTLDAIINTFRYHQLPDMSGAAGGSLLTYPNIVQISISNAGTFPYRFKPAVIESLSINFTPAGQPSVFGETQRPTEVEIRLGLLEIEFYLQRDYGTPSTAGLNIGFNLVADAFNSAAKSASQNLENQQSVGPIVIGGNGLPLFGP